MLGVGGVFPGWGDWRQPLRQLLVIFERATYAVGLDGDIALGVDQLGTERLEDRARGVDVIFGPAQSDAEWVTTLVAGFDGLEQDVERSVVRLRGATAR